MKSAGAFGSVAALITIGLLGGTGCQKLIGLEDRHSTGADVSPLGVAGGGVPVRPVMPAPHPPPDAPPGTSQACVDYCSKAVSACTADEGAKPLYADRVECYPYCAQLEKLQATEQNPVECRVKWLEDFENPQMSCVAGSPTGGGQCGDVCDAYCDLFELTCGEFCKDPMTAKCKVPVDGATCRRQCRSLRIENQNVTPGGTYDRDGNAEGDTLQCRFRQLVMAATTPESCRSADLNPTEHCFDKPEDKLRCDDYCNVLVNGACVGDNAVYENVAQCKAACSAMEDAGYLGKNRDAEWRSKQKTWQETEPLNTIGCRRTHSFFAFAAPAMHCGHSGPTGATPCGNACESFCVLAQAACDGYDSKTCLASCQSAEPTAQEHLEHPYTVKAGKQGGDLNCRVLHVTRALPALPDSAKRAQECAFVTEAVTCPHEE